MSKGGDDKLGCEWSTHKCYFPHVALTRDSIDYFIINIGKQYNRGA